MGLEQILPEGFILTSKLEDLVNWGRANSPWPLLFRPCSSSCIVSEPWENRVGCWPVPGCLPSSSRCDTGRTSSAFSRDGNPRWGRRRKKTLLRGDAWHAE